MSAIPPQQTQAMRETASDKTPARGSLAQRWEDLHDQATQLAKLAQLSPEPFAGKVAAFPSQISSASEWQRELAWQGVEDIDAMMQPGLSALATIAQRGIAANAPALALWREFHSARSALLSLTAEEAA